MASLGEIRLYGCSDLKGSGVMCHRGARIATAVPSSAAMGIPAGEEKATTAPLALNVFGAEAPNRGYRANSSRPADQARSMMAR